MNINELGQKLSDYCQKYKVPVESIFQILDDQKVVPMIRGKATEYSAYVILRDILSEDEWSVQKLNLNAQSNTHDEDISITHRRSGIILKVECKNAVRGSFKSGSRSRISVPYCTIKCHRSRSNISLAGNGGPNDRYSEDSFDIIISNLSNSVIAGGTMSENFELIDNEEAINILASYYNVSEDFQEIFDAAAEDWRFVVAKGISENGYLPRTPVVLLENDPHWKNINEIEASLHEVIREKLSTRKSDRGKSRR